MNKKRKKMISIFVTCFMIFTIGTSVLADDDHEHENEMGKNHEKYERDDDTKREDQKQIQIIQQQQQVDYWNIWSRKPRNNQDNLLPITSPSELKVMVNHKEFNLFFIPQHGQVLVSGEAIANVLGAEANYFVQTNICILKKDNHELIVRAGSNAAYENRVKTPMPVQAQVLENSVYLPVSVAANALGFRVSWDETTKTILFQSI
jgi:hypothetical protein